MSIFDLFAQIEKPKTVGAITHLIVGLGNPGKEYEWTRHNAGFLAMDALAKQCGVTTWQSKFHALVADATIADKHVLLMKPQTFMNLSGQAVIEAANFYKIAVENILVYSDDISLDIGQIRIRRKGSHGGHNGLRNIIDHLGSDAFARIKIGVGKKAIADLVAWVLGPVPPQQRPDFLDACERAAAATPQIIKGQIEQAMNAYNS